MFIYSFAEIVLTIMGKIALKTNMVLHECKFTASHSGCLYVLILLSNLWFIVEATAGGETCCINNLFREIRLFVLLKVVSCEGNIFYVSGYKPFVLSEGPHLYGGSSSACPCNSIAALTSSLILLFLL